MLRVHIDLAEDLGWGAQHSHWVDHNCQLQGIQRRLLASVGTCLNVHVPDTHDQNFKKIYKIMSHVHL